MAKSSHPSPLMKADAAVISFASDKSGKIRIVYSAWDECRGWEYHRLAGERL
jgi:hypothetical protein